MIELIILDHLSSTLQTNEVYLEVPDDPPASFIVIDKTGGGEDNLIGSATLAIQSYGATMLDAATLNELVKSAMDTATESKYIYSAKLDTDYNFTDTRTKRYRYQAVYDITFNE